MTDDVKLRVAHKGDGVQLIKLLKRVAKTSQAVVIPHLDTLTAKEEDQQLSLIGQQENCLILLAELKSQIIGVVTVMPPADLLQDEATSRMVNLGIIAHSNVFTGELGIAVDPDFQGQGLGTALVDEAQYWLANYSRLDAMVLTVFNDNQPARVLYQHAHFVSVGPLNENGRSATMMVWLPK